MIGFLGLMLLHLSELPDQAPGCEWEAPVRDPEKCEPLNPGEAFEVYSLESVAVGSTDEMQWVREKTRHCGVPANRIDHVGSLDVAVYDLFNATRDSRTCVLQWIEKEAPQLKFSEERFSKRFREAPLLDEDNGGGDQ